MPDSENNIPSVQGDVKSLRFERAEPGWAAIRFVESPPALLSLLAVYGMAAVIAGGLAALYFIKIPVVARGEGTVISEIKPVDIRPTTSVIVRKLLVRENEEVKKGQVLFETDRTVTPQTVELVRQISRKFSGVYDLHKKARCGVKCARDIVLIRDDLAAKLESMDLSSEANELKRSLTSFANAEQRAQDLPNSTRDLNRELGITQQKLKAIKQSGAQKLLALDMEKLESQASTLQAQIRSQTKTAQAEADGARELTRLAIDRLNETLEIASSQNALLSPVDGVIKTLVAASDGQKFSSGEVLAQITPTNSALMMEFLVAESELSKLKPGQQIQAEIGSYPTREFGFVVSQISSLATEADLVQGKGAMFRVRAKTEREVKSSSGKTLLLKPGMTISADVIIKRERALKYFVDKIFNLTKELTN